MASLMMGAVMLIIGNLLADFWGSELLLSPRIRLARDELNLVQVQK